MTFVGDAAVDRRGTTPAGVARLDASTGRVEWNGVDLHPLWLRERSTAVGAIDPVNRQRLYEPTDVSADLSVVGCRLVDGMLVVDFSDGHRASIAAARIDEELRHAATGERVDEDPPAPIPWTARELAVPFVAWADLTAPDAATADTAALDALGAFFRFGWFVLRGTPCRTGALHDIAGHFGRIAATNFGTLFDVRTEPVPTDLAYTPIALAAHTDQPYRRPSPGIQFLHTIVNDAPGGESTVVDGLAAIDELRRVDPAAFELLSTLPIEFRYDIGTDVKVMRAPLIELADDGSLREFRFSPRLDFAPAIAADVLDVYYRGRRWLAAALNDPSRQLQFRMEAGDVLVVDNHRVLHGRTAFDPTRGSRHLQGCYIDHDGPATMWTLATRRRRTGAAAPTGATITA